MKEFTLIQADQVPSRRRLPRNYERAIQKFIEMPSPAAYVEADETTSLSALNMGFRRAALRMNVGITVSSYSLMSRVYLVKKVQNTNGSKTISD